MQPVMQRKTHVVGTLAIIMRDDRLLLLRRNTQPMIWAPPGGRLLPDEHPEVGIRREVAEECNIEIEILMPIDTWFGSHDDVVTLGIIYLAHYNLGTLRLSSEHVHAHWFTKDVWSSCCLCRT